MADSGYRSTRAVNLLYKEWLENPYFGEYAAELRSVAGDRDAVRDRFYRDLEFGTAGIRGIMGAGTNRINVPVVRRISAAIASVIVSAGKRAVKKGVVIGYDSRNNSLEFARAAASVFAGYGIKTQIFDCIVPVPLLSYSVRKLKTYAGIMITASHNPKEYNGYKVYGSDGAQLSPEDSAKIVKAINRIKKYDSVPGFSFEKLLGEGAINYCPEAVKQGFIRTIRALLPEDIRESSSTPELKAVYTPIHGAGAGFVPLMLKKIGVRKLYTVKEQMAPDGNFSTVNVPNPEDPKAYTLALKLAEKYDADIILATDPDSDRTGAWAKNAEGKYEMLSGNEIGEILIDRRTSDRSLLPAKPFAVSTIVSTRLTEKICADRGVRYTDVLTGFKFIGEQIKEREERGDETFIFGFEESYGYLAGSYARDKDAVASCMLLAEAAAYYKKQGLTLFGALDRIYAEYGAQQELQTSLSLPGEKGAEEIRRIMSLVRGKKENVLKGEKPVYYMDFLSGRCLRRKGGRYEESAIEGFPESDVLYYSYENFWFCFRPSGTEPKIKLYFGAGGASRHEAYSNASLIKERVLEAIRG